MLFYQLGVGPIRVQLAVVTHRATHPFPHGCGPIYGLRYRNQGHVVIGKNLGIQSEPSDGWEWGRLP